MGNAVLLEESHLSRDPGLGKEFCALMKCVLVHVFGTQDAQGALRLDDAIVARTVVSNLSPSGLLHTSAEGPRFTYLCHCDYSSRGCAPRDLFHAHGSRHRRPSYKIAPKKPYLEGVLCVFPHICPPSMLINSDRQTQYQDSLATYWILTCQMALFSRRGC